MLTHKINFVLLNSNNFYEFIRNRATQILNRIDKAMCKPVSGRDSEETIKEFWEKI